MTLQDRLKNLRFEKDFTLEEVSLRLVLTSHASYTKL